MLHRPARSARAASFLTRRRQIGDLGRRRDPVGASARPRAAAANARQSGHRARWASTSRRSTPGSSPSRSAEMASRQRSQLTDVTPTRSPPAAWSSRFAPGARRSGILSGVAGDDPLLTYLDAAREGDGVAVGELVRQTQPAVWQMCQALGSAGRGRGPRPGDLPAGALRRSTGTAAMRRCGCGCCRSPGGCAPTTCAAASAAPADRSAGPQRDRHGDAGAGDRRRPPRRARRRPAGGVRAHPAGRASATRRPPGSSAARSARSAHGSPAPGPTWWRSSARADAR